MKPRNVARNLFLTAAICLVTSAPEPSQGGEVLSAQGASTSFCRLKLSPQHHKAAAIAPRLLQLDSGKHVRLTGIEVPETTFEMSHKSGPEKTHAATELLSGILKDSTIRLAHIDQKFTRHGHLLAHTFASRPGKPRVWLQAALVENGLARVSLAPGETACAQELLDRENSARARELGYWRQNTFRLRNATSVRELKRLRNTFQFVRGRIKKVSHNKGRIYLNFADDWRADFTVGLNPRSLGLNREMAKALDQSLQNAVVEVRGWIEEKGGPYIALHNIHQIRVLRTAGRTKTPK